MLAKCRLRLTTTSGLLLAARLKTFLFEVNMCLSQVHGGLRRMSSTVLDTAQEMSLARYIVCGSRMMPPVQV